MSTSLSGITVNLLGRVVSLFGWPTVIVGIDPSGNVSPLGVTAAVAASQTLTFDANPTAGDTFTLGRVTYTMQSTMAAAYDVKIGASAAASLDNIKAAVNASGTAGTEYFAGTLAHPEVTATTNTDTTQVFAAKLAGGAGNAIATTETFTSAGNVFGATTLASGAYSKLITTT